MKHLKYFAAGFMCFILTPILFPALMVGVMGWALYMLGRSFFEAHYRP